MTKPVSTPRRTDRAGAPVRTRAQVKAEALALAGTRTRVATAATDDPNTTEVDAGTVGELWLYGVVGGFWRGFNAESVANALRGMDVDTLYVRIHSPGGYASDGIAIGNLLRNHAAKVIVVVDGLAASAASVIAIAGDEIVMCPGSQMMLHDASTFAWGNAADIRRVADWIDSQSENYAGVYAYRAGGTTAAWRTVMVDNGGDGTWYTAEGAVAAGLADSVGTRTAVGSPPTAPDEDDLDDEDTWARATHDLEILDRHVHPAARAAYSGQPSPRAQRAPQPPSASAVGSTPTHEGSPAVAFTTEQLTTMRTQLGVAEDADEATILAALTEALDERADESTTTTTTATAAREGYTLVPDVELATLRTGADAGTRAAQTLHDRDREAFLDAKRAKIPTALRASWAKQYDRDPAATRASLESMADIVPVAELGHNTEDDDSAPTAVAAITESPAYKNWSM